jgi:hypothetical protein
MWLARFAFQACSIDHSDISPFRINHLRVVWNSLAQNPPSNPDCPRTRSDSATCERTRIDGRENCVRPSNLLRSLTATSGRRRSISVELVKGQRQVACGTFHGFTLDDARPRMLCHDDRSPSLGSGFTLEGSDDIRRDPPAVEPTRLRDDWN